MADDDFFSGDIDPEIASLLGLVSSKENEAPDYEKLFNLEDNNDSLSAPATNIENLNRESFTLPQKDRQAPNPLFSHSNYYKSILSNEGQLAQNIHKTMSQFLDTQDPEEKTVFRTRLMGQYWELYGVFASRIHTMPMEPKRMMLRFGLLLPKLISKEQQEMLGSIIEKNETGEPVYYVDEWLEDVSAERIAPLARDELHLIKKSGEQKLNAQLNKLKGSREAHLSILVNLQNKRKHAEEQLNRKISDLSRHAMDPGFPGLEKLYTTEQRRSLTQIMAETRALSALHKDMGMHYNQLNSAETDYKKLQLKVNKTDDSSNLDSSELEMEAASIRQMAKMCTGRQGNHFPILMKQFFTSRLEKIASRENIIKILSEIEAVDPGLFQRTFRHKTNRIVPRVIIVPCYGDFGICWEPFERHNRATSRGRIAIPFYPRDVKLACLYAVADLRWQIAKEKAQHYWMEEGLTGHYYHYFIDNKLKGDVKRLFIEDYILWITKEGEGVQKLDKELRGIFWRDIPFPQEIKDNLRNRGYVYNELYKKDLNRAASDGY